MAYVSVLSNRIRDRIYENAYLGGDIREVILMNPDVSLF